MIDEHDMANELQMSAGEGRDRIKTTGNRAILVAERVGFKMYEGAENW